MKWPSDLPALLGLLALLQRLAEAQDVLGLLGKGAGMVTQEVADAKNPIAAGISYVGSSQCKNVKRLFGVDYEQVEGVSEPDVDNLTLNYISPNERVIYYLRSVGRELSVARGLDPSATLVLFMHGFTDNPDKNNFQNVNDAFQSIGHHCILALDASPLIRFLYLRSSTYVRFIGNRLGEALAELVNKGGLNPKLIHLVGHSLGAHISSFAAKRFTQLTGLKVARLTGLDPAGPCFSQVPDDLRLKETDAEFVDAIHTDGGVYGLTDTIAQADFFPNGGTQQPNCFFESCSHSRAVELFAESIINPGGFPALRCNDYDDFKRGKCSEEVSLMGLGAAPGAQGRFYLQTNVTEPYAQGRSGLVYVDRDGVVKSVRNVASQVLG